MTQPPDTMTLTERKALELIGAQHLCCGASACMNEKKSAQGRGEWPCVALPNHSFVAAHLVDAILDRLSQSPPRTAPTEGPPRMFPIMDGPDIPWSVIAPCERQAVENHSQSLERLNERGGLGSAEAVAVLQWRRWRPMDADVARATLADIVAKLRTAPTEARQPLTPEVEEIEKRHEHDATRREIDHATHEWRTHRDRATLLRILKARTPTDREELYQAVAKEFDERTISGWEWNELVDFVLDHALYATPGTSQATTRDEALEEAAEVAYKHYLATVDFGTDDKGKRDQYNAIASAASNIADEIRALKSKPSTGKE